ncbi:MAG TPA: hypothetical protein VNN19_10405 [bacterium]|nr:hypothetical protein [bacterium]
MRRTVIVYVHRKADGFEVGWYKGQWHCRREDAVIARVAEALQCQGPEHPVGQMREKVQHIRIRSVSNGYYVSDVSFSQEEYKPTRAATWEWFLAQFERPGAKARAAIRERVAEARQAVRSIEENVQAMRAENAPTREQFAVEEQYLDEILAALDEVLAAAERTTSVGELHSSLPGFTRNTALLQFIKDGISDVRLAAIVWQRVRENHNGRRGRTARRYFEELVTKAERNRETWLRRWARQEIQQEARDAKEEAAAGDSESAITDAALEQIVLGKTHDIPPNELGGA